MDSMGLSREHARILGWCGAVAFVGIAEGCQRTTTATAPIPAATIVILAVPASPESTVKLAKVALGAIDGLVQLPQVRPAMTTVSTHYVRNRRGGGQTEVAVIAAVDRLPTDTLIPVTRVELGAWALDMAQAVTATQRRSGLPTTPLSQNAPAIRRPRAITAADTNDWKALDIVAEAFIKHGARRVP